MGDAQMKTIIDFIPSGHANAVTRENLTMVSGFSDREVRRQIEMANNSGFVILNNGDGYFQYKNAKDRPFLDEYIASERSRMNSIRRKITHMKEAVEE